MSAPAYKLVAITDVQPSTTKPRRRSKKKEAQERMIAELKGMVREFGNLGKVLAVEAMRNPTVIEAGVGALAGSVMFEALNVYVDGNTRLITFYNIRGRPMYRGIVPVKVTGIYEGFLPNIQGDIPQIGHINLDFRSWFGRPVTDVTVEFSTEDLVRWWGKRAGGPAWGDAMAFANLLAIEKAKAAWKWFGPAIGASGATVLPAIVKGMAQFTSGVIPG